MNDDFDLFTGENCKKYSHENGLCNANLGEVDNSTIERVGHWSGRGLLKLNPYSVLI